MTASETILAALHPAPSARRNLLTSIRLRIDAMSRALRAAESAADWQDDDALLESVDMLLTECEPIPDALCDLVDLVQHG